MCSLNRFHEATRARTSDRAEVVDEIFFGHSGKHAKTKDMKNHEWKKEKHGKRRVGDQISDGTEQVDDDEDEEEKKEAEDDKQEERDESERTNPMPVSWMMRILFCLSGINSILSSFSVSKALGFVKLI